VPVADQTAVRAAAEPVLASLGLELVDIEVVGSGRARTLRLTIDREGGIDLETLAQANGPVSEALDRVDALSGPYNLELSSPGVERPLRRPAEFRRFVGTTISVKSHDTGIVLEVDGQHRRLSYDAIASARTVFEWGPSPKPIGPPKRVAKERPLKERSV
jgi:ribosome maturation factor RimP